MAKVPCSYDNNLQVNESEQSGLLWFLAPRSLIEFIEDSKIHGSGFPIFGKSLRCQAKAV